MSHLLLLQGSHIVIYLFIFRSTLPALVALTWRCIMHTDTNCVEINSVTLCLLKKRFSNSCLK